MSARCFDCFITYLAKPHLHIFSLLSKLKWAPLLAGRGEGKARSRIFSIFLRSVPVARFQSTRRCSIFPFFFTVKYPCYPMFNTSKPYSPALQHLKSVKRGERYVRCNLFPPFAMSPTQPFLSRRAKSLPKRRGRSVAWRDKNGCNGGYPLHRLSTITQTQ